MENILERTERVNYMQLRHTAQTVINSHEVGITYTRSLPLTIRHDCMQRDEMVQKATRVQQQ